MIKQNFNIRWKILVSLQIIYPRMNIFIREWKLLKRLYGYCDRFSLIVVAVRVSGCMNKLLFQQAADD